ncbi:MAG: hypothetical protein WCD37_09090 [Chloroflexia bacterium]
MNDSDMRFVRRRFGLRAVVAGLVMIASLPALASSSTSRASTSRDDQTPITNTASIDLCALIAEAAPVQNGLLDPGMGAEWRGHTCTYWPGPTDPNKPNDSKPFDSLTLQIHVSAEFARAQLGTSPSWIPTSLGDSGYGYEVPAGENDAKIRFARNCFLVFGNAGYDGSPSGRRDIGALREFATALDTVLQRTPCPEDELDLTVDHMEVVQVIQTRDNKMPLVAGKKTVVRVFVKASGQALGGIASNVRGSLFVWPEGKSEVEVPSAANGAISVAPGAEPNRNDTNGSLNFVIPPELTNPGVFSLKAVINPARTVEEKDYDNNELTEPFEFEQRNSLRIGYVRIGVKASGDTEYRWPTDQISQYDSWARKLFPVGNVGFQYYEMPWRVRVDQAVTVSGGSGSLLWDLWQFRNHLERNRPDVLVGWLPTSNDPAQSASNPDFGGVAYIGEPSALASDYHDYHAEASQVTLAHELGHSLGLNHTGTRGDPSPPCTYASSASNYWPQEYGGSAAIREPGFDTEQMTVVPGTHFDLMSYCAPLRWISPFHYQKLDAGGLRPTKLLAPPSGPRLSVLGELLKGSVATFEVVRMPGDNAGGPDGVSASALLPPSGAYLLPGLANSPFSLLGEPGKVTQVREGTGGYCLRFMDAGDALLYERCFDPPQPHPSVTGEDTDEVNFVLELPDPGNVARVVMVRTNGVQEDEIGSLTVSSNAPTLSIISPESGDRWEGEHTIEWSGDDADGDAVRYDIMYSADNKQSWYPIAVRLQETQYTFSTDEILPGDQTYIRILASDGYNTTTADVGPLVVPKQPNSPEPPPPPPGNDTVAGPGSTSSPGGALDSSLLLIIGGGALFVVVGLTMVLVMRRSRRKPAVAGAMPSAPQPTHQPAMPPTQPAYQPPYQPAPPVYPPANMGAVFNPFQGAEQDYWRLRNALAVGQIPIQQYQALVRQLVVRDARGYSWMLGEADGLWYVYDGRAWVRADPGRSG